jgi:hypothetical protein
MVVNSGCKVGIIKILRIGINTYFFKVLVGITT